MRRDDDVFAAALETPRESRATFLVRACAGDLELRARVDALLAGANEGGNFLQQPLLARGAVVPNEKPGDVIGRYTLLEKIGEGGCGVVWRAEQREPVKREVALKVIKLGMDTKEVIARFEAERQALALMDHPNIARVFDGGATDSGRPFFVMELVRGVPITRFCDEHALGLRERIELFIAVCEAVQHAHQKGIIHRDLKPSNILVAHLADHCRGADLLRPSNLPKGAASLRPYSSTAVPKVIDFGIAKATQGKLTDATLHTAVHQFIGTPAYMSPEQADSGSADIDTRSDIYSLGVLLYELLTGETPFERGRLSNGSFEEIRERIRTVEPSRPSARLRTLEVARAPRPCSDESAIHGQDAHATSRAGRPCHSAAELRGDLDWIVMRCLEKDRTRRYDTANGLAMDLQRHLRNEPVLARPPSTLYLLQKLIRRHRFGFGAAAAIALLIVVGGAVSTWQAVRATRAEREQSRLRIAETEQRQRAETQERVTRRRGYAADMNLVQQALAIDNLGRARELLDRHRPQAGNPDLRAWEWRYLWQQCQSDAAFVLCQKPDMPISSLSVSADGDWLSMATGGPDNGVPQAASFSIWNVRLRKEMPSLADGAFRRAVFSPRGPVLAIVPTGNPRVMIWNVATRQLMNEWSLPGICSECFFSGDGTTLMTLTGGLAAIHCIRWRVTDGRRLEGPTATIDATGGWGWRAVAATPDLRRVAVFLQQSGFFSQMSLVDLDLGATRWTVPASSGGAAACAISPDGNVVASYGGDSKSDVWLWDGETGKRTGELKGHHGAISALLFSQDGKLLVTGSTDQTIRVWDMGTRRLLRTLRGHERPLHSLALAAGGTTLFSGDRDGRPSPTGGRRHFPRTKKSF